MSEKMLRYCLKGLLICLGGYLLARGFLYLREDSFVQMHKILGNLCESTQERALTLCFPQYMTWEHQKEDKKMAVLGTFSALLDYMQDYSVPKTMEEDQILTKEIITLHNKLILDEILQENQKQEKELPVWAQLTQDSVKMNISMETLKDLDSLLQQFFVVDADTTAPKDLFSAEAFMKENMSMEKKNAPQILIYHTHSQEGYADSIPNDEETTVVGVGNYLAYLMEEVFGYQVIHIKNQFDIQDGYIDRNRAYDYALPVVEQVLEEYPSIEVVIDLHRDGVDESRRLVTQINGKPTAKIMLFNGLSRRANGEERTSIPNSNIEKNLAFSFQLAYQTKTYYPDFLRCIYLKGYRYNLHVRGKSILLEVGAQTNTVEEAKNAMEPFSVILNKVLNEE